VFGLVVAIRDIGAAMLLVGNLFPRRVILLCEACKITLEGFTPQPLNWKFKYLNATTSKK